MPYIVGNESKAAIQYIDALARLVFDMMSLLTKYVTLP